MVESKNMVILWYFEIDHGTTWFPFFIYYGTYITYKNVLKSMVLIWIFLDMYMVVIKCMVLTICHITYMTVVPWYSIYAMVLCDYYTKTPYYLRDVQNSTMVLPCFVDMHHCNTAVFLKVTWYILMLYTMFQSMWKCTIQKTIPGCLTWARFVCEVTDQTFGSWIAS